MPETEYSPAITGKKALQTLVVSSLLIGLYAAVDAFVGSPEVRTLLPLWATPLFTAVSTAVVNFIKNYLLKKDDFVSPPALKG